MKEKIMRWNYKKAFVTVVILAVVPALVSAIAVSLSLSQQIRDAHAWEQTAKAERLQSGEAKSEHDGDREHGDWGKNITPLGTLRSVRWPHRFVAGARRGVLAAGDGVAVQKRGLRGHEQIHLANPWPVLQSFRRVCVPDRPRPTEPHEAGGCKRTMRSEDHLALGLHLLSRENSPQLRRHCIAFLIGCIEPDYNQFSYLRGIVHHRKFRGHNAEDSFTFLTRCRKHFALHEASSAWDFFKLGTMLHYAADAFT